MCIYKAVWAAIYDARTVPSQTSSCSAVRDSHFLHFLAIIDDVMAGAGMGMHGRKQRK